MGLKEIIIGKKPDQNDLVDRFISFLDGGNPDFSPSEVDKAKSNQTILTLKNNDKPLNNKNQANSNALEIFSKVS